ncbi:hypothetical protein FNV43_RR05947 [Rhamnella rubrinervis]|uniref:Uncharacterized protein n=1 Tax=Rhamnella rubrinervis TaxID=2594499 RepID=A0A8K0HD05_9ROSA|nr:hypothetical protein FNV43_RR05947 [Rhamnella rubrinervis]
MIFVRKMSNRSMDAEEFEELQRSWLKSRRETLIALLRDESLAPPADSSDDSSSDSFMEEDPEEDPEEESEPVDEEIKILEYEPEMERGGKQKDRLGIDESEVESVPRRLQTELRRQASNINEAAQVMLQALAENIGHQPAGPRDEIADVVERFRRQRPPTFSGSTNPIQVDNWIREIEMAFELMTCSETQKVICATHLLRDSAMH